MTDIVDDIKKGEILLNNISELLKEESIQTCVGVLTHILASISVSYRVDADKVISGFLHQLSVIKKTESDSSWEFIKFDKDIIH